ncbi:MAG TPA: alpha/beta fold hydrolase, partial [Vicinamibacteria bacterium]|nr:alpha/beta fold hydrolase [Vicinamibacteria bacterium]
MAQVGSSNGFFRPHPWLAGGHRQTLLGFWCRRFLRWTLPSEDLVVDAGEDVRLLLRATWQPGRRADRPALVVVHGLGGCDASPYVVSAGRLAFARGWHVVRMNMRGAGDGEAMCPRLYNAGLDTDLLAAVEAVAPSTPRVAVAGFSLGAGQALLALGRLRDRLPRALRGAAAVSPALDLAACADALARPENRLYQRYFMDGLREAYRRRARRRPDLFEAGRERGTRTVRDYDQAVTAHYGGYRDAADYYERSSAGPWLGAIDRPALILAAADDPMIPSHSVVRWPIAPAVRREIAATGGHVGFVGRSPAPGFFCAPPRLLDFLEEAVRA